MLRTLDWMDTHNFAVEQRMQRFPLAGEARLWYQSTHPFQGNSEELQEEFRTQFFKTGYMREQLLHAWRSLHYDKNSEITHAHVQRMQQVAEMLNYSEPQILQVFKKTPTILTILGVIPN